MVGGSETTAAVWELLGVVLNLSVNSKPGRSPSVATEILGCLV